jgi:hypothetical protein
MPRLEMPQIRLDTLAMRQRGQVATPFQVALKPEGELIYQLRRMGERAWSL